MLSDKEEQQERSIQATFNKELLRRRGTSRTLIPIKTEEVTTNATASTLPNNLLIL